MDGNQIKSPLSDLQQIVGNQAVQRFFAQRSGDEATELDELSLAYVTTIHRSQGSEYPVVIVPIMTQHFFLLQRNLLYTAITRASKRVWASD